MRKDRFVDYEKMYKALKLTNNHKHFTYEFYMAYLKMYEEKEQLGFCNDELLNKYMICEYDFYKKNPSGYGRFLELFILSLDSYRIYIVVRGDVDVPVIRCYGRYSSYEAAENYAKYLLLANGSMCDAEYYFIHLSEHGRFPDV